VILTPREEATVDHLQGSFRRGAMTEQNVVLIQDSQHRT
jgi:hypothetical protein